MQCYTELTPPTAVAHSVALPFVSAQSNNLIVAKSSLLQIFTTKTVSADLDVTATNGGHAQQSTKPSGKYDGRLVNDDEGLESSFLGGDALLLKADRTSNTKLVLVAEVPLAGTITGMARIKTPTTKSGGDALLIAFKDAKLSLVEWDPDSHSLYSISIHYYEQEDLYGSPWAAPLSEYVNVLAADPGSRCAALKFGAKNLAILPFTQPDEDMGMDDWDEELDGPRPLKDLSPAVVNGASSIEETPYSSSFVLRLPNLDPSLLHPVHLAFLHEYREPTFGILSSTQSHSHSLGRKDHLSYMVFTLDLQQKASTTILAVGGLPQDLFRVVALPAPVGGALLVGANELIHINQSGKPHGVAVNPLAKQSTSFGLVDQSALDIRLEACAIDVLSAENGDLLIVLSSGLLALVTFQIDGRTVSGLAVRLVPEEAGGCIIPSSVSSLTRVGRNALFAGLEGGDSLVLGWTRKQGQASRRKAKLQDAGLDIEIDAEDLDDEDDLYGEVAPETQSAVPVSGIGKAGGDLAFRIHDRLLSIAPIRAMTYGEPVVPSDGSGATGLPEIRSELQLACVVGTGAASSLAVLSREVQPRAIGRFEFPEARGFWTMSAQRPMPKSMQGDKNNGSVGNDYGTSNQYDTYMIVAKVDLDGYETSDVYALTCAGFEGLTGTEFEPAAGYTVEAGAMGNRTRIIQVLKSEVRCYDGDLGLSQILPMLDEETGAEPRVVSASISDPYLLLIRDDSSAFIAHMDSNSELEELGMEGGALPSCKWISGCLYVDKDSMFAESQADREAQPGGSIVMFLLSAAGALHLYRLPDLSRPIYVAQGLFYIPPLLSSSYSARKGTARESVKEILVADLGDTTHNSPYLILRHRNDDITMYEPLRRQAPGGPDDLPETLSFKKTLNPTFAKEDQEAAHEDAAPQPASLPMRTCRNVAGYSTVFLPGASPAFVIKSAKSPPRVMGLRGPGVQAMSPFHTEGCDRGFIYADSHGIARVAELASDHSYGEVGLAVKKIPLGIDASAVSYHPPTKCYVLGCNAFEPFELPRDDDYHKEWAREVLPSKPRVERGCLRLVTPVNWSVIDAVDMEPCEVVLCVETLNLEVSESTNERKQLIAVGTAISRGEDLPIRGRVHVYDIADVIPEPGRPETNRKLKLVAREDIPRGAITAISEVGTQGLMLIAQGQKCMVRGLKEDGTLLPVAFMDMSCYVTSIKELPGTGLCLMSDAFKGVWFTGYTEEPYKMMLFGKSATNLEILNADFLPDGQELFIIASDPDANIHILQFDPEHPKSLQGHLLLHRTTFCAGAHVPTSSLLLPHTAAAADIRDPDSPPPHLLLLASSTGVLAALTPLPEPSYRRLSSLAAQLVNSLPPAAGLNPRSYRTPSASSALPGVDAGVGRSVVDGTMLTRWVELGTARRAEISGRVGFGGPDEVRVELGRVLGWTGLAYF